MGKRRRADGEAMDPVVLEEAINAFKARKEQQEKEENAVAEKQDAAKKRFGFFAKRKKDGKLPLGNKAEPVPEEVEEEPKTFEERVDSVKKRRDKRDEQDEPGDARTALGVIAEQDEDIDELLKIIEEMGAKKGDENNEDEAEEEVEDVEDVDFEEDEDEEEDEVEFEDDIEADDPDEEDEAEDFEEDKDDEEEIDVEETEDFEEDEDDEEFSEEVDEEEDDEEPEEDIEYQEEVIRRPDGKFGKVRKDKKHCDNDRSRSMNLNLDGVDRYVASKLDVCRVGDLLGMKGLEKMSIAEARKAVVRKVNPGVRLDGKSDKYVAGMYQSARSQAMKRRRTDAQRRQIFNSDGAVITNKTSAELAREKMIKNMKGDK